VTRLRSPARYLRSYAALNPGSPNTGNAPADFTPKAVPDRVRVLLLTLFGLALAVPAFFLASPAGLLSGNWTILTSPANLLTDYVELADAGSTLLNAGLMCLIAVATVKVAGSPVNGLMAAAVLTVTGFSFFGKNLLNSIPIVLGVYLFSKIARKPFSEYLVQALFGTALGPLVSEIAFNLGLSVPAGLALGYCAGIFTGLILPPLSLHFKSFHKGFNLYNVGFTAGIVGMFFIAVLRAMGVEVATVSILSKGNNRLFAVLLLSIFAALFIAGLLLNGGRLRGLWLLQQQPGGLGSDYIERFGFGCAAMNMALLGLLCTLYVLAIGGEINGPVIGGILTVAGFGAAGKNVRNVAPIILGVYIGNLLNVFESVSTVAIVATLFGTTLAPVAGYYGPVWGILAGLLHMALTMNISYLHGGMNLYNNGFSGGFIAAALVPVITALHEIRQRRRKAPPQNEPAEANER